MDLTVCPLKRIIRVIGHNLDTANKTRVFTSYSNLYTSLNWLKTGAVLIPIKLLYNHENFHTEIQ